MDKYDEIVKLYEQEHYRFELFMNGVYDYFRLAPALREEPLPLVHSLKSRLKDPFSLTRKASAKGFFKKSHYHRKCF